MGAPQVCMYVGGGVGCIYLCGMGWERRMMNARRRPTPIRTRSSIVFTHQHCLFKTHTGARAADGDQVGGALGRDLRHAGALTNVFICIGCLCAFCMYRWGDVDVDALCS